MAQTDKGKKNISNYQRVLIVDPDAMLRDCMCLFLEGHGCEVKAVATAGKALDSLRRRDYGIVLCARYLPDTDGLDFFRTMTKKHAEAVKILESDQIASDEFLAVALQAGVNDFFYKPLSAERLEALLGRYLQKQRFLEV